MKDTFESMSFHCAKNCSYRVVTRNGPHFDFVFSKSLARFVHTRVGVVHPVHRLIAVAKHAHNVRARCTALLLKKFT